MTNFWSSGENFPRRNFSADDFYGKISEKFDKVKKISPDEIIPLKVSDFWQKVLLIPPLSPLASVHASVIRFCQYWIINLPHYLQKGTLEYDRGQFLKKKHSDFVKKGSLVSFWHKYGETLTFWCDKHRLFSTNIVFRFHGFLKRLFSSSISKSHLGPSR